MVAVLIAVVGVLLIRQGMKVAPRAAPLPAAVFSVQPEVAGAAVSAPHAAAPPGSISANPSSSQLGADPQSASGTAVVAAAGSAAPRQQQPVQPISDNHLAIPALGIDAPITPEVITAGALTIPGDVSMVGVWTGSAAITAATGTVLLAGHIDNIDQGYGALHDLYLLQPGDRVFLQLHGVPTVWQIVTLAVYPKAAIPTSLFDGPAGTRRLALVTCGGQIHGGEYDDNVIATAVPA